VNFTKKKKKTQFEEKFCHFSFVSLLKQKELTTKQFSPPYIRIVLPKDKQTNIEE
jgi:plasmid replication initiation protein